MTISKTQNGTVLNTSFNYNGKELQLLANTTLIDYGARQYNPTLARWTTQDPMAEKYYGISPYAYCAGNPILLVEPNGMVLSTDVVDLGEGKYEVVDSKVDGDTNVYVVNEKGERIKDDSGNYVTIGQTLTQYSFIKDNGEAAKGAIIDLNDKSGERFFNEEIVVTKTYT